MREIVMQLFVYVFFSFACSLAFFWGRDREVNTEVKEGRQRYSASVLGILLLAVILALWGMRATKYGWQASFDWLFSTCFQVFIQIAVYETILLFLMSRLREKLMPYTCYGIWFLPYFLYMLVNTGPIAEPLVKITLSESWRRVIVTVWGVGFAAVLLQAIVSHLLYRRKLLADAHEADDRTRMLWEQERHWAGINKQLPLLISRNTLTPVSVGVFRVFVVLPERSYTEEELQLIFRHELIHISRSDGSNKFFLMFCTAMCWFNPLMWKAMRCSAEDMELSCDETVLLDADEETRARYARLLLDTAGDERGFTTCLAASAQALRYRLKNVMTPLERENGFLLVACLLFFLVATYGWIVLG